MYCLGKNDLCKKMEGMFSVIKGIGIDIIELDRIEKAVLKNNRFPARVLTNKELNIYEDFSTDKRKVEFLAGRFAVKEAFAKALGTGIGKISFQDIEVLPNEAGSPCLSVSTFDTEKIFVSISHSKAYAVAQVIITL